MNGMSTIRDAIAADSAVMASLDHDPVVSVIEPKTWAPTDRTISIYSADVVDYTLEYLDNTCTANCRAGTEREAALIAYNVVVALNRKEASGGGRYYCSMLPVLVPVDETDSYNVPVEIQIKGQRALN